DGRLRRERDEIVGAGLPRDVEGRAVRRLDGEETRRLEAERGEAPFEAEDVAAVSGRHQNIVGDAEAELFPDFEGKGLGALDKEWVPVVAGVVAGAAFGQRQRGGRHVLT